MTPHQLTEKKDSEEKRNSKELRICVMKLSKNYLDVSFKFSD